MNAKKIMGAVLVALLAVTAFAGVAAADEVNIGSVPVYTDLSLTSLDYVSGEFVADDGTVIVPVTSDGSIYYFAEPAENLGKVYKGAGVDTAGNAITLAFTLVAPTTPVSALYKGISIIGQTVSPSVALGAEYVAYFGTSATEVPVVFIKDGVEYNEKPTKFTPGKWAVAANLTDNTGIGSPLKIIGQPYYFTVAKTEASISAAKDTVNIGENIVISVLVPGQAYAKVYYDGKVVKTDAEQAGVTFEEGNNKKWANVTLGLDGKATVAFKANEKGKTTFTLNDDDAEVEVTIVKGVITAVADKDSYYLGKPISLSGTTTAGDNLYFYIEGTNFDFMNINALGDDVFSEELEVENGAWTVELDSTKIVDGNKVLVAGTYTIIVATENKIAGEDGKTLKETVMSYTYGTAAVTMTQPFITDVKAAATAVQGTDYEITGTAIAAKNVKLYIFGTSYFNAFTETTDDEDAFKFEIAGADLEKMAPGTYFYLIQHPMNDELFNVWNATDDGDTLDDADFYYAATNPAFRSTDGNAGLAPDQATFIFNAWKRGTNYAAQALLDEISGQNIDDIFVQGTFEVAAQKLTINPIPAEVAKGTKLAITGSTNSGEGVEVIVNVLAGKFGATIKGDENAATFLTAKGITQEDGTFEAAIDTSKLEVGSYIVTVEIAGTMYDSAAVEIVEKAPVTPPADDKPDTPVTPPADDKPTEPETPGFGALAALAGLGAVAVLLLRRE